MFFDTFENRCALCEYYEECEYAEQINFCEDCRESDNCAIRYCCQCKAGHDIECNNGFEPKYETDWEEDEDEEG